MLRRASEAAKAPSALSMIHFMYFIVDSVHDDGWSLIVAASNEIYLFGSAPKTIGWCRRIRTKPSRTSLD